MDVWTCQHNIYSFWCFEVGLCIQAFSDQIKITINNVVCLRWLYLNPTTCQLVYIVLICYATLTIAFFLFLHDTIYTAYQWVRGWLSVHSCHCALQTSVMASNLYYLVLVVNPLCSLATNSHILTYTFKAFGSLNGIGHLPTQTCIGTHANTHTHSHTQSSEHEQEFKGVINNFVSWCETNQHQQDERDGHGLQAEVTPYHTSEHQKTLRQWTLTSTWLFT